MLWPTTSAGDAVPMALRAVRETRWLGLTGCAGDFEPGL
jgi:hypothetical protein